MSGQALTINCRGLAAVLLREGHLVRFRMECPDMEQTRNYLVKTGAVMFLGASCVAGFPAWAGTLAQAEVTIGPYGFGIDASGTDRDRMRDRERNHDRIRTRLGDRDRDRGCLIVAVEERGEIHTVQIHCSW